MVNSVPKSYFLTWHYSLARTNALVVIFRLLTLWLSLTFFDSSRQTVADHVKRQTGLISDLLCSAYCFGTFGPSSLFNYTTISISISVTGGLIC